MEKECSKIAFLLVTWMSFSLEESNDYYTNDYILRLYLSFSLSLCVCVCVNMVRLVDVTCRMCGKYSVRETEHGERGVSSVEQSEPRGFASI